MEVFSDTRWCPGELSFLSEEECFEWPDHGSSDGGGSNVIGSAFDSSPNSFPRSEMRFGGLFLSVDSTGFSSRDFVMERF